MLLPEGESKRFFAPATAHVVLARSHEKASLLFVQTVVTDDLGVSGSGPEPSAHCDFYAGCKVLLLALKHACVPGYADEQYSDSENEYSESEDGFLDGPVASYSGSEPTPETGRELSEEEEDGVTSIADIPSLVATPAGKTGCPMRPLRHASQNVSCTSIIRQIVDLTIPGEQGNRTKASFSEFHAGSEKPLAQ